MLRPSVRTEKCKKAYKTQVNANESRRWREKYMIEIRNIKRNEYLLNNRGNGLFLHSQDLPQQTNDIDASQDIELNSLLLLVKGLWSEHPSAQLGATTQFGKLFSIERSPPVDVVLKAGVVQRFVDFLGRHDLPQLQFEAAWVLGNLASGSSEHTSVLIQQGVVPKLVQLLESASDVVREQAVLALGYVASDSPSCRVHVLNHGALIPLLSLLNDKTTEVPILRNATWTLSNLCHPSPASFEQLKPALHALRSLIYVDDEQVIRDACLALSYLSDGPNEHIQAVIESGVCPRLLELLTHMDHIIRSSAHQTVGNILTGDDSHIQFMIEIGVLPCLQPILIRCHWINAIKKTCWMISNITAGNSVQIQAVIDSQLVPWLVTSLQYSVVDLKREAAWAICNATSRGSHEQIQFLVSQGCIKPLCDLLACGDQRIVTVCVLGLENILRVGEADKEKGLNGRVNLYANMVDECTKKILETDTDDDDDDDDDSKISEKAMQMCEKAVKRLKKYLG